MSILDISGMSKKYGSLHALQDITFSVEPGEWVSIMGSSGSGKSTMLNMIGLMDKPTGEVQIDGIVTTSLNSKIMPLPPV
ncbi:ATP-binding cassette domain-containing protein [Paenibacillus sp. FSL K6-3166]|uniref:ATP-binding cassette domain-containing protein n=1 Tax=Paenibacillus sp. FSL K6-3166 TaxID=2921492 RepID=UPI0030FA1B13